MPRSFSVDFEDDAEFLDVIQCAVLAGQRHATACPEAARIGFSVLISDDAKRPIYEVMFKGGSHTVRSLTTTH